MTDMLTPIANGAGLSAPVRNRYFYGKLLDVHNLEMEQDYFLEMGRLINRLTLGSGVLCGLHVKKGEGQTVVVSPGVAVDGHGREIVVTEQVTLDLGSLEEDTTEEDVHAEPVEPTPAPLRDAIVLCLSYHECDVEPSPVLVADCDLREGCAAGAVRERYKFTLMPAAHAPLPEDPCGILGAYRGPGPTEAGDGESTHLTQRQLSTALEAEVQIQQQMGVGVGRVPERTAAALRQRLCGAYRPPCGPGSDCVPVALIEKGSGGGVAINECLPRRTIYSNAVLLDLILCLAEQMEKCCERKVTVTAPKIVETWPPPPDPPPLTTPPTAATLTEVTLSEMLDRPPLAENGGIAISFDRAMNDDRLHVPAEWLRVLVIADGDSAFGLPFPLKLTHIEPTTLSGNDGQTAYYGFEPLDAGGLGAVVSSHVTGNVGGNTLTFAQLVKAAEGATVLVLIRSDDVTQIAAAEDSELLDADFHGTSLTPEVTDMLWSVAYLEILLARSLRGVIATPALPMPALPSGNNIEGGVFHSSFHITPQ